MAEIADGALPQPATDTLGEAKEKSLARTQDATSALASAPATVEKRAEPSKTATMTGEVQARNRFKQEVDNMKPQADVSTVRASGQAGAYEFNVTLRSPDSGCQQYADWWEVVSEDGKLLYRRVLLHSHVQEQPFTRSGGPVPIQPTTQVWVRAHMNNGGYGGTALKGSVQTGFVPTATPVNFAAHLATQAPLPTGCDF